MTFEEQVIVRAYEWALDTARRQAEERFPLLASCASDSARLTLEAVESFDTNERASLAAVLAARRHPVAMKLAGASLTREQESL